MRKGSGVPILLLAGIILTSCQSSQKALHILTDRKELAVAIELFAGRHEGTRITFRYVEALDDAAMKSESPDLIIGSNLNTSPLLEQFRPISSSAEVYPGLKGPVDSKGIPLLQPLSFQLPLIMGRKDSIAQLPDAVMVKPENLRTLAPDYAIRNSRGRLTRMSFSPSWNPALFIDLLAIRAPGALREDFEQIDDQTIDSVLEEIREWVADAAGDEQSDFLFSRRYRYLPDDVLLREGRIQFVRTDFNSWAALPSTVSKELGIRYFSGDRAIPVSSVTWAGIPKQTSEPELAEEFVEWLLLPETQSRLMEKWEKEGIHVFGFLGGLSSIPEVNDSPIVHRYPELKGMIPENHYLAVTSGLPQRWPRIRDEVIYPWFNAALQSESPHTSLSDAYRRWDLSSLLENE